jgi:hypothetical protein
LTQGDIKDILFYNFFDLNKYAVGSKGDKDSIFLNLGNKDVLRRYEDKVKRDRLGKRASALGQ